MHSIQTEYEICGMIANIEILPSLTEFDHFKMDDVALLQLLKQLIQVHLVFNPGGKLFDRHCCSANLSVHCNFSTLGTRLLSSGVDCNNPLR